MKKAKQALRKAQRLPISQDSCEECVTLEHKLDHFIKKYKVYWYIRSRVLKI